MSEAELSPDTMIWRYMPYSSFELMINGHALFFARPFTYPDKWEGYPPPAYYRRLLTGQPLSPADRAMMEEELRKMARRHRYAIFVNCWHIAKDESDMMWRTYSSHFEGLAIQSSVGAVRKCISIHGGDQVTYYDPGKDDLPTGLFAKHAVLHKRIGFAYEREYRFYCMDGKLIDAIEAGQPIDETKLDKGILMTISGIQKLLQRIVLAPGANSAFKAKVDNLLIGRSRRTLLPSVDYSYMDREWASFAHNFRLI